MFSVERYLGKKIDCKWMRSWIGRRHPHNNELFEDSFGVASPRAGYPSPG
jgi:hypothetical protein